MALKTMKKIISILIVACILTISSTAFSKRENKPGKDQFIVPGGYAVDLLVNLDTAPTKISGIGMGGQVDCFLYSPKKLLVAYDVEPGSNCNLKYTAKDAGTYIIKLVNYSEDSSKYTILTN